MNLSLQPLCFFFTAISSVLSIMPGTWQVLNKWLKNNYGDIKEVKAGKQRGGVWEQGEIFHLHFGGRVFAGADKFYMVAWEIGGCSGMNDIGGTPGLRF